METSLQKLTQARQWLAEAKTLDDVKHIMDIAEAARAYARAAKLGLEAYNDAAEVKVRAERMAGEMLAQLERDPISKGGSRPSVFQDGKPSEYSEVLQEQEIPTTTAFRWQQMAKLGEDEFEQKIDKFKKNKSTISTNRILQEAKQKEKINNIKEYASEVAAMPTLQKKYNVIYADPPWKYSDSINTLDAVTDSHYATMTITELKSYLDDTGIQAADNSVLFLWVTNPFIVKALEVIETWGFEYKTNIVWVKTELKKPGVGYYVRGRHELLFICTRGSFTPLNKNISPPIGSVLEAPVQEHSKKPEEVYTLIERLYPNCVYLELFARQRRKGWDGIGNEL